LASDSLLKYPVFGEKLMEFKGYEMPLETAERFYRLCLLWNLKTQEERVTLLNHMIHTDDIKILTDKMLKKRLEGKRGFYIGGKPHNDGPEHRCPECQ
jgi:hypothetical protein